jgi:serine protease AprX
LDGKTSLTSQAAEVAFSKGMIVVNSAGNEGKNDWKGLAMPADGPNVLAIGAVNQDNQKCDFSSIGWVSNRGVKPDLVALGIDVAVVSGEKAIVLSGQGTSYAAPLVSGLVATLWQAYPYATNQQIMEAIRKTANSALHPNQETGFGVPNFSAAFNYLEMKEK